MHRVRYEALPVSLGSTVWCSISRATSHGDVVSRECIIQSDDIVHLLDNHAFIDVIHRVHIRYNPSIMFGNPAQSGSVFHTR